MNSTPARFSGYRLVVCLGPGGVGKTTLSAALAVSAALGGPNVDVMTVDPAPRLLDALGIGAAGPAPKPVPLDSLGKPRRAKTGPMRRGTRPGRLRALKLDPKHTFDTLVIRYAPSPAARDAILANRIYHNLSSALSGVADYMAMERLLELYDDGPAGLIVLDTPPTREALDFLDAPRRLVELLNSRAVTLLGASQSFVRGRMPMVDIAARAVLAAFDRLTRLHLLSDVQAFVASFDGMYGGFAERARRAQSLLHDETTCLVLVTTAEVERVAEAREFIHGLESAGLNLHAMVVNRLMPAIPDKAEIASPGISPALRRKLEVNLRDFAALKRREAASLAALRQALPPGAELIAAPDLGREPRTLADLAEIGQRLKTV